MSVENIRPVIIYPVDNVEAVIGVPFEFPFVALGGLTVKFVDRDTGVQTLLQLNVHYTRAGNTITLTDLAVPLFSGTDVVLVISRAVEFTQEISFTEGDDFYAETVNDALDALVYQTQDLNERLRGVLLPPVGVDQVTWEAFMEALNNAAKVPGMELTIAQALLDIITAQAAADLGIEKADTAQATADAGVSGAAAAHQAAVEAQTTANEAVGLANDAQATADEAMSLIEPATTTTRGTVTLTTEEGIRNGDPNLVVTADFLKLTNDVVAQIIAQSAPDATETVKGVTTRATTAKALAGTDNISFLTPALMSAAMGQFGLFGKAIYAQAVDLNSYIRSGIYAFRGTEILNSPVTLASATVCRLLVLQGEGPSVVTTVTQIFFRQWWFDNQIDFDIYVREYRSNVAGWTSWRRIYPVEEATVDTIGGGKLGTLATLIAGDDEGRVVPQSLVRQLLGHELEWKRLPYQDISLPSTALPSFGNGRMMMSWHNSSTTQMFVADNRGETILPRTVITALAHMAANYSPRWGSHVFMSNSTSFRWTYDGDTWTIGTVTYAPTNMGLAATCVTRNGQAMFFAVNYSYVHAGVGSVTPTAWTPSWSGTTAAAHNDATGTTVALGYNSATPLNSAYIMRAVNNSTSSFTRTLALPFAMTQPNTHKLTCGNGIFVGIVTGTNCVFRSTDDGVTWTTKGLPDGLFAQDIAFGDGKFVIATPYNCNYVYVSADGENWTTVSLPALTYSNVMPRIAFYDGDFYILRPNRPVGRVGVTSWFLRRRASTIPAIGDPLVLSIWNSFTINSFGVVVPTGFNTLNWVSTGGYAIRRNRNELLVAAGSPAGSVQVSPGDFIYAESTSISGCSFTYQLLPPVTLTWGSGNMASGTQINMQSYVDLGYTKATYVETSVGSTSTLVAQELGDAQVIRGEINSQSEGSFTLDSLGGYVRGTYGSGGSIILTLTEGTAPAWDGYTVNGRREYMTLAADTAEKDIMGIAWTNSSTTPVLTSFWYMDLYARGQVNPMSGGGANITYQLNDRAEYDVLTWDYYEDEKDIRVSVPLYNNFKFYGGTNGDLMSYELKVTRRYTPRLYVENAIEVALPASYVVPAGMTVMHLRMRIAYASGQGQNVDVRKNGELLTSMSNTYDQVEYGTYNVQPGDVITVTKTASVFADAVFAGRGSYVDMTPVSGSPATTMPAIGVAPVQAVPVVSTVEEGENLGANYPIAEPVDWSKRSFKLYIDATGKFPVSDKVTVPYDYKYVKGHITGIVGVTGQGSNAVPRTGGYQILRSGSSTISVSDKSAGQTVTRVIDGEYNYNNAARKGKRDICISDLVEGHWTSLIMELTFFNEEEV